MLYKTLFSKFELGSVTLPNRLVMPAITTNLAANTGEVTEQLIDFYTSRAAGGVGMVEVEHAIVSLEGKRMPCNLGIWDDSHIPGLKRLSTAIKAKGSVAALQIGHGGRESNSAYTNLRPVAPSALPSAFRGTTTELETPIELDLSAIKRLQECFIKAALRARTAGFEAVELHGCHGYLISQFLSPYSNKRCDAYGGSVENRARFLTEIIVAIKKSCGLDFPVIVRINGNDYVEGGNTVVEAAEISGLAEKAGADAMHISACFHASPKPYHNAPGLGLPEACFVPLAEAVKKAISIPVIAVARIGRPALAEEILSEGKADLIAMGRPLICDPELPLKAKKGKEEEIFYCRYCNRGCLSQVLKLKQVCCVRNSEAKAEIN